MASRKVGDGRTIRLPEVDSDQVPTADPSFAGEFDMDSMRVDGGEHAEAVGEGSINTAVLERVDLSRAKLGPLTLADVVLHNAELSNASLQRVVARRVAVRTCRTIGLKLSIELATDLSIEDCRLDYANLHLEKVKGGGRVQRVHVPGGDDQW